MSRAHNTVLNAALALARRGFYLFPVVYGKKYPFLDRWRDISTVDEAEIEIFFCNRFNIGIDCGKSNVVVIDIDPEGFQNYEKLFIVSHTLSALTPSGGMHLYFSYDHQKKKIGNTVSKLAKGIDTRGYGGYVLAPPSIVKKEYTWLNKCDPEKLPETVISLMEEKEIKFRRPFYRTRPFLEEAVEKVRYAPVGTRNNTLNLCAFLAAKMVLDGKLDYDETFSALLDAALFCGLGQKESIATIKSAFRGASSRKVL